MTQYKPRLCDIQDILYTVQALNTLNIYGGNISQIASIFGISRAVVYDITRKDKESNLDNLKEAMGYIYYYDNVRKHLALSYQTPFSYLKTRLPDLVIK